MPEPSPAPPTAANEKWLPYRHPQPKESPPELVVPNAMPTDERIWVPVEDNVWFRPLLMCVSRGYWMNLLRVRNQASSRDIATHCPSTVSSSKASGATWNTTGSRPRADMSTKRPARPTPSSSIRTSRR